MNQRLPRIALLVVMFLSMLAVFQMGESGTPVHRVLAQSCGPWVPFEEAEEEAQNPQEPPEEEAYQVIAEIDSSFGGTLGLDLGTRTTSILLFGGNDATFISSASAIIWIESGPVVLTVCGGPSVAVEDVASGTINLAGPGTYELNGGSSVYVPAGAEYYLSAANLSGTPGDAIVTSSTHQPMYLRALCSGGSC